MNEGDVRTQHPRRLDSRETGWFTPPQPKLEWRLCMMAALASRLMHEPERVVEVFQWRETERKSSDACPMARASH